MAAKEPEPAVSVVEVEPAPPPAAKAPANVKAAPPVKNGRIGIIFVHGIGEQRRFSHLDNEVRPLIEALKRRDPETHTTIEISAGSASILLADQDTWSTQDGAPVRAIVKYDVEGETGRVERELNFHEVWWADVNEQYTFKKQFLFWMWGLGMWLMPFQNDPRATKVMRSPVFPQGSDKRPQKGRSWLVRLQLYTISNLFLMGAFSVGAVVFVIKRVLGYQAPDFVRVFVNYLSAVRLYTQAQRTGGGFLDAYKEPPRVSIRRRMIRTITDVALQDYDRWYIFGHSLGSVVAFNGVMENNLAIPNYLDRKRWKDLCDKDFAGTGQKGECVSEPMLPARPNWLADDDVVYREKLFERFAGLLTYGSPLDKFAMLWPAQVPINFGETTQFQPKSEKKGEPLPPAQQPEWINVYDPTDPVGAALEAFERKNAGELCPENYGYCAGRWWLASHLKFLKVHEKKRDELSDALVEWVLGGAKFEHAKEPTPWFEPFEEIHHGRMAWRHTQQFFAYVALLLMAAVSLPFIVKAVVELLPKIAAFSPPVPKPLSAPFWWAVGIFQTIIDWVTGAFVWLGSVLRRILSALGVPDAAFFDAYLPSDVSRNVLVVFLAVALVTFLAGVIGRLGGIDPPDKKFKPGQGANV